jgi:type III secretion system FlhB-like substrate exporter
MEAPAYEGLPFVDFAGGKAEVTANTIKVSGHAKIQVGKILYAASKPTLISILKDLEQGDQCVQKMVKLHAEVLANLLKMMPHSQLD